MGFYDDVQIIWYRTLLLCKLPSLCIKNAFASARPPIALSELSARLAEANRIFNALGRNQLDKLKTNSF